MKQPELTAKAADPIEGGREIIVLRDVRKIYQVGSEEVRALDGVDLTVEQGEYLAIMGASGSGKSTLMNLLGMSRCARPPGATRLNGVGGRDGSSDEELAVIRNEEIGFVFQTFNLLARTSAQANVELPLVYAGLSKKERRRVAERALERVGLADRTTHRSNELSGGQRQRVAVARALVNDPSILLADEPTGNLDSTTSAEIMELFDELNRSGNTVLLVTHEDDIAEHAHRVITLRDGKIIKDERTK